MSIVVYQQIDEDGWKKEQRRVIGEIQRPLARRGKTQLRVHFVFRYAEEGWGEAGL